jgi:hypothetical protein
MGDARWGWRSCRGVTSCISSSTYLIPGVEEALYESPVLQRFVGVDLGAAPAPDETTICRFCHPPENTICAG